MSDAARIEQLETLLANFLQPMRGVPFSVVVKALSRQAVIPVDRQIKTINY